MTGPEFQSAINAATTVEELRAAVEAFAPIFAKMTNTDKGRYRAIWKRRQAQLGVTV